MNFEILKRDDYTLIRVVSKKLDTNNAPALKSELVMIKGQGVKNIVIDIGNVGYCDSSGLSAFLVANRSCEENKGTFVLTGCQPEVFNLIRISMLHTILHITSSEEEAISVISEKNK